MMNIEINNRSLTSLSKALQEGATEGEFDGTYQVLVGSRTTNLISCHEGERVHVITVDLQQTKPPLNNPEDGLLVAGIVDVNPKKTTVLFEQKNPETVAEGVARRTLDKACLEAECTENGCVLKKLKDQKEKKRNDIISQIRIKKQHFRKRR